MRHASCVIAHTWTPLPGACHLVMCSKKSVHDVCGRLIELAGTVDHSLHGPRNGGAEPRSARSARAGRPKIPCRQGSICGVDLAWRSGWGSPAFKLMPSASLIFLLSLDVTAQRREGGTGETRLERPRAMACCTTPQQKFLLTQGPFHRTFRPARRNHAEPAAVASTWRVVGQKRPSCRTANLVASRSRAQP